MPLSNDKTFGVRALSEAINLLPQHPTIVRTMGLFKPSYLATTYVEVEYQDGRISLVEAKKRGLPGEPLDNKQRHTRTFNMLHLPVDDVVRADDVQNLRAFGSNDKATAVVDVVNDKLADAKNDIEYTREHLMLGALLGKILNKDGATLFDLYQEFGIARKVHNWALGTATTKVGLQIDKTKTAQAKLQQGEAVNGYMVLASPEFMQALVYHDNIEEIYLRYQEAQTYRQGETHISFEHKGVKFVQYDHAFESGEKIPAGEAIWLPLGTRNTFREFFAPADMNSTVNTKALAYYASREKLTHDKGWSLHAQSNPLPLVLRPELVATIKMA